MEDVTRMINVPNKENVLIGDLLFPVVKEIALDPVGPYTVAVGAELEITPVVQATDYEILDGAAPSDVIWASSDDAVAGLAVVGGKLILRGIAAGTCEITATRYDQTIIRIPDVGIIGQPIAVTVTP